MIFGRKIFVVERIFGRKNILVEKVFWSKKFFVEKSFDRKKILFEIDNCIPKEKKMATARGEFNYLIPPRRKWRRAEGNSIILYQIEENGDGRTGIQLSYTKEKKMVTAGGEFNYLIRKRRKWRRPEGNSIVRSGMLLRYDVTLVFKRRSMQHVQVNKN